jgi:caffeoyl-CoA O-methyltransferase
MSDDAVKSIGLGRELLEYVIEHSGGRDPIATELAVATREQFGDAAQMNVEQDQGRFLEFLVAALGARTVVEVGTFTGMSALFLARGLPPGGRLVCLDVDARYPDVGRPFWQRAGVADRIEVRIAPAADSLSAWPADDPIDLVFIDADKPSYGTYLDLALDRLAPQGVVAVDNVLWSGAVVDAAVTDANTAAIRAFNDRVEADPSLRSVMLGIGDGVTLIRRR